MFADRIKAAMSEQGISQAELSKLTGIGRSSICQYLSGKIVPAPGRKALIAEVLGVDPEEPEPESIPPEEETVQRITVMKAARILHMNHVTLREGLKQGRFPWGYAVRKSENRWSYYINAKKFAETEGVRIC